MTNSKFPVIVVVFLLIANSAAMGQSKDFPSNPEIGLNVKGLNEVNPQNQEKWRLQPAWQQFAKKHPQWQVWFNQNTGMPHRAFGKPFSVKGKNLKSKSLNFLKHHLEAFSIDIDHLQFASIREKAEMYYVKFHQVHEDQKVLRSSIDLRFTSNQKLAMFGIDYYPNIEIEDHNLITKEKAVSAAKRGLRGSIESASIAPELKILPINNRFYQVYKVKIKGQMANEPFLYYTLVNANNGKVLYRRNRVLSGKPEVAVKTDIVKEQPGSGLSEMALPHLKMSALGDQYVTNDSGKATIDYQGGSVNANFSLSGRYAEVRASPDSTIPNFSTTLDSGANRISFNKDATLEQRTAYYHTNFIHDYMKEWFPGFEQLDMPIKVHTGLTIGSCNAFYRPSNNSINFFQGNEECPSYALISDIVYHEYGHAINRNFYQVGGEQFRNGALNEGFADIWAFGATNDPVLGEGSRNSGDRPSIRRYDENPKVYPDDLVGEVHADGEIIAGAFWELRKNLDSLNHMMDLFTQVYFAMPNAMRGEEGALYRDVLLEVLLADDDDNNLSNGTPNDNAITEAFAKHGITLASSLRLKHQQVLIREPGKTFKINADITGEGFSYLGKIELWYRFTDSEDWKVQSMKENGGNTYQVSFAKRDTGELMAYFFKMYDQNNNLAGTYPIKAGKGENENLPYFTLFGYFEQEKTTFANASSDWKVTGDANTGQWEIGQIIGSFMGEGFSENPVQPSTDNTEDGLDFCAFTGNAPSESSSIGEADIDRGSTVLTSPWYDINNYNNPVIAYHRWFTNDMGANPGNDPWAVYIQGKQEKDWHQVEFTYESQRQWRRNILNINKHLDTAEDEVRLRFIGSDSVVNNQSNEGQSLVEAAVDDITLYSTNDEETAITNKNAGEKQIKIYPNPTSKLLKIEKKKPMKEARVVLRNLNGQKIMGKNLKESTNLDLEKAGVQKGIYLLSVEGTEFSFIQKVVYY